MGNIGKHPRDAMRDERLRRGWTVTRTARLLSISTGYYSKLERGLKEPSPVVQARAEILFGIPSGWPVAADVAEQVRQNVAQAAEAGGSR